MLPAELAARGFRAAHCAPVTPVRHLAPGPPQRARAGPGRGAPRASGAGAAARAAAPGGGAAPPAQPAAPPAELLHGTMPLVGLERAALALPPALRGPLQLHSFVLLDRGSEVRLGRERQVSGRATAASRPRPLPRPPMSPAVCCPRPRAPGAFLPPFRPGCLTFCQRRRPPRRPRRRCSRAARCAASCAAGGSRAWRPGTSRQARPSGGPGGGNSCARRGSRAADALQRGARRGRPTAAAATRHPPPVPHPAGAWRDCRAATPWPLRRSSASERPGPAPACGRGGSPGGQRHGGTAARQPAPPRSGSGRAPREGRLPFTQARPARPAPAPQVLAAGAVAAWAQLPPPHRRADGGAACSGGGCSSGGGGGGGPARAPAGIAQACARPSQSPVLRYAPLRGTFHARWAPRTPCLVCPPTARRAGACNPLPLLPAVKPSPAPPASFVRANYMESRGRAA
jgi:hypothetical protein